MQISHLLQQINATCPACGLLCDDVVLENSKLVGVSCAKSIAFFGQKLAVSSPQIGGNNVTLVDAVAHAAHLLKQSQQPLFSGLSTDLQGFRSVYHLAQKTNATLQHLNAASLQRNLSVLQSTGWQTTTLTEVKNRADVIVCFGDIAQHNPRFFERFIDCDGLFVTAKNRQVICFNLAQNTHTIKTDALETAWILPCRADDLPSVTIALRALVAGKQLKAAQIAGINVSDLQSVANKLKAAKYAVLAWVAKDFEFNHAELSIQNITETVALLNKTSRAAGLPLGGSDGDTSANNAHTWLSGLTLRDEPIAHDLMLWVNSFSADKSPKMTDKPLIVIGNSNLAEAVFSREATLLNDEGKSRLQAAATKAPDVFIPVATPGLDCSGTLFRVDSAVVLPLKKVRESDFPTLSDVLKKIEALL